MKAHQPLLTAVFLAAAVCQAQPTSPVDEVGFDQRLGVTVPLDITLCDETGARTTLGQLLLDDRPVVLLPAYYRCPMLCNLSLAGLRDAVAAAGLQPGRDYAIVVFSFDPLDTPQTAAAKRRDLLGNAEATDAAGWHFLVGSRDQVAALCQSVGFRYRYDQASGQYAHAAGLAVLTPQGRVSRYLYGVQYAPRDLRLALVEASQNRIGRAADRVLLLCFAWDPSTGKYSLLVMNLVRLGAVLTLAVLGTFLWRSRRLGRPENT